MAWQTCWVAVESGCRIGMPLIITKSLPSVTHRDLMCQSLAHLSLLKWCDLILATKLYSCKLGD